jgi:hypothetical protein
MHTASFHRERIDRLKSLQAQWTVELAQISGAHPERALHLSEALDDLKTVIGNLEGEQPSSSSIATDARE